MIPLLGRRNVSITSLLKTLHNTYSCSTSAIWNNSTNKYLLSKENRERCMKKMCRAPPVAINAKGNKNNGNKLAAVLIALCIDEDMENLSILYTRRSHLLNRHMRQISFPGGMKEDDEDFVQCALRETQEEIGLSPSRFYIWGSGNLIALPRSAAIMPIVGTITNLDICELKLNVDEVEDVFFIPIKTLASPQTLRYTQFKTGYSAPVFVVDDKRIWGITGYITNLFLNCLLPPQLNKLQNCVRFIRSYKCKS